QRRIVAGLPMSYDVLKNGWFGWNMPASMSFGDGRALQCCRIRDIRGNRAKLEVHRGEDLPDRFWLHLTESGSLPLECKVTGRERRIIEVELRLLKRECSAVQPADPSTIDIGTLNHSSFFSKSNDTASRHRSRQDLEALREITLRRRTGRGVTANALFATAFCAAVVFVF